MHSRWALRHIQAQWIITQTGNDHTGAHRYLCAEQMESVVADARASNTVLPPRALVRSLPEEVLVQIQDPHWIFQHRELITNETLRSLERTERARMRFV